MVLSEQPPRLMAVRLAVGTLLLLVGLLWLTDQRGLRREFYALTAGWQGSPVYADVADPHLRNRRQVAEVLVSQEIFSLRWRGWVTIESAGTYRFAIRADEEAYLAIGGDRALTLSREEGGRQIETTLDLERGLHRLEIGTLDAGRKFPRHIEGDAVSSFGPVERDARDASVDRVRDRAARESSS